MCKSGRGHIPVKGACPCEKGAWLSLQEAWPSAHGTRAF